MARRTQNVAQEPPVDLSIHYANLTTIDAVGGASQSQILVKDIQAARGYLRGKVNDAAHRNEPIIAAYLYDTASKVLSRYRVVNHEANLPTIIEEGQ